MASYVATLLYKVLPSKLIDVVHPALKRKCPHLFALLETPFLYQFLYIPMGRDIGITTNFRYSFWVEAGDGGAPWEPIYGKTYERFFDVEEGDVVIDIGANIGSFTVRAARRAGADGKIIAIEPEPRNLALLRKNTKRFANVTVLGKAVGSYKGSIKLHLAPTPGRHSVVYNHGLGDLEVDVETVDNIVSELGLEKVNFIKIDVELAELEVLKGAEKTLALPGVKVALEYHGQEISEEIGAYMTSKGIEWVSDGKWMLYARTSGL